MGREDEKLDHLREILTTIMNDEIMDVGAAVERSRTLSHPLQHSSVRLLYNAASATMFAQILFQAHQRTGRLDYLNEAIIANRDRRKVPAPRVIHFQAGYSLLQSVIASWDLLHLWQDVEEALLLFPEVANDGSAEVFHRFEISSWWAYCARAYAHPSISTAYETAVSLMQKTLVFSPTLQTQHFRLAHALRKWGVLPSDYASYQIEMGQFKQAIDGTRESVTLVRNARPPYFR